MVQPSAWQSGVPELLRKARRIPRRQRSHARGTLRETTSQPEHSTSFLVCAADQSAIDINGQNLTLDTSDPVLT